MGDSTPVPEPIQALGKALCLVQSGGKGPARGEDRADPSRPEDPTLRRHLRDGGNYGIVPTGDLAFLDVDDPDALNGELEELPETVHWPTATDGHECHLFRVPGLDRDVPLADPETGENVGHVKANPVSYVVGPGSQLDDGRAYGPVDGSGPVVVEQSDLFDAIERFQSDGTAGDPAGATGEGGAAGGSASGPTSTDGEPELDDVLDRSEYPSEQRLPHPFHRSGTGKNFKVKAGREIAYCYRHDSTLRGPHLWAIREGVIRCSDVGQHGELRGSASWREIYDALRADGWDIPEPGGGDSSEDADNVDAPDVATARERCRDAVHTAVRDGQNVLVDAIPSLGKSHAAATAMGSGGVPVTYLTHLTDNRDQVREWATEAGFSVYVMPRAGEDCPVLDDREGDDWKATFERLYERGVRPRVIHELKEDSPCQADGECPYLSKLQFDAENFDVIVGSPVHAHMDRITEDRAVIFDEDPGQALETVIPGPAAERAADTFVRSQESSPLESVQDALLADDDARERILRDLTTEGDLRDVSAAFGDGGRPEAPAVAYGWLTADDLCNGFDRATLPDGSVYVRNRELESVTLRSPPDLGDAHAVIGLDGTPALTRWRGLLDADLDHRRVLTDAERRGYLTESLGNEYIQTTDHVVPCAGGRYVKPEKAARMLRWVGEKHGERPGLITSKAGLRELIDDGDGPAGGLVDGTMHYNALKGSNEFSKKALGVVYGAPQLSDGEIKRRAALDGLAIEREDTPADFGDEGNQYLRHTRDDHVGQAALRFGRDDQAGGAIVYVHTSAVPDWLPVERQEIPSDGELRVLEVLVGMGKAAASGVGEAVETSARQARTHLRSLEDAGIIDQVGNGPTTRYVHRPNADR